MTKPHPSVHRWECKDKRFDLRRIGFTDLPEPSINAECQWNEAYSIVPADLECVLTHCDHPHDYLQGSHEPPPAENALQLVTPADQVNNTNWRISFGSKISYQCTSSKYFELPVPTELDPTQESLEVECLQTGTYNTPPVQSKVWPNCTETVLCGPPPPHPINGVVNGIEGFEGSIKWLHGAERDSNTYNTTVEYACANGSQFDTNDDGRGDVATLQSRCQWDKTWSQPNPLPSCQVTHCIVPFAVPNDTFLVEVTSNPTPVNQHKQYECFGKINGTHTRYLESDRAKSTFEMLCLPNGTFQFDNLRSTWPTCLEDVLCNDLPPEVPTHEEYTLPSDDGSVHIEALDYPEMKRTDIVYNSNQTNSTLLPRNYMANLTYNCGSAREFIGETLVYADLTMTCQWNRSWTPSVVLDPCDWVACLKPPNPPKSTNLRVTGWDGGPIPFGEKVNFGEKDCRLSWSCFAQVHFVCERGHFFEEDHAQEEITYECQDGTVPGTRKGFFNNPEEEDFWPKCLQGWSSS